MPPDKVPVRCEGIHNRDRPAAGSRAPRLALLLAGPALSLPNMLVIRSVLGTKKTVVFVSLVIIMATISGMIFGAFVG